MTNIFEVQSSDSVIPSTLHLFFASVESNNEIDSESYIDAVMKRVLDPLEEHY